MRVFLLLLMPFVFFLNLRAQNKLSGQVIDKQQNAIESAIVTLTELNQTTETDNKGNFSFNNIPHNTYTIRVFRSGYNTLEKSVELKGNSNEIIVLEEYLTNLEEVVVSAIRAQKTTPTTYSYISKKDIGKLNLGQDAPYVLNMEPSVVVSSDAGTGIGYTGLRLRGSDLRKINVTINGVPLNDPESHGVFWVDVPDVASSVQSIQIQRGVGTSTNGSGAFGGSINLQTDNFSEKAFAEYSGNVGSFNTFKNSLHFGSGLINKHWFAEAKVGQLNSDGYRDRAWSNLKSYFAQAGYVSEKTIVKLVGFGGWEETYQAWYSVSQSDIDTYGRKYNPAGYYIDDNGNDAYYDKMIDHYQQDHLQLHFIHKFSDNLSFNAAAHYTYGRGYYQDYVPYFWEMPFSSIGLEDYVSGSDTVTTSDFIHRMWLKNHFYGSVFGLTYTTDRFSVTWGGAANNYAPAKHFGEVTWVKNYPTPLPGGNYYDNEAEKSDLNTYIKANFRVVGDLYAFADMQLRRIHYKAWGLNREYVDQQIDIDREFNFFNPKAGVYYQINSNMNLYASVAVANREPNRADLIEAGEEEDIKNESLYDYEAGFRYNKENMYFESVFYNMIYDNQLVLTGELNSVGTPLRQNVGSSYRRGIELSVGVKPLRYLKIDGNISLSSNKTDFTINDTANMVKTLKNVSLAFSPDIVASGRITFYPFKNFEASIIEKHVGKQYLDNTENESRILKAYTVFDFSLGYNFKIKKIQLGLNAKLINMFDEMYSSNGSISGSGKAKYYPQAGRHILAGITVRF